MPKGAHTGHIFLDLTGQRFVSLVALERTPRVGKRTSASWKCQCDCGNIKNIESASLRSGNTKSCGCRIYKRHPQLFVSLVALERTPRVGKRTSASWKCQCDCGNIKNIESASLRSGNTKSCGCRIYKRHPIDSVFGSLTVKEWLPRLRYLCVCKCGGCLSVKHSQLTTRLGLGRKSCGCAHADGQDAARARRGYAGMPRYFADMVGSYRGHARKKKIPFELTLQQFYDITQQKCHYCGDSPRLRNLSGNDVHENARNSVESSGPRVTHSTTPFSV